MILKARNKMFFIDNILYLQVKEKNKTKFIIEAVFPSERVEIEEYTTENLAEHAITYLLLDYAQNPRTRVIFIPYEEELKKMIAEAKECADFIKQEKEN